MERLTRALGHRYAVRRELGRGGMATVYLAEDLQRGEQVALKVLMQELVSAVGSRRFVREIEIMEGLEHPHVLPLLDSGQAEGLLYLTMPLVTGGTLSDRLDRERQLPLDDAVRIAGQVASALSYAHSRAVIHRDIKPSNIMLDTIGARVTDFGIALVPEGVSDRLTVSGLTPGSPEYMSPEQASGDRWFDERSDIYSLGCVLFEMLTGDPPYTGSTPQAILAKKLTVPTPSPRVVRESVPEHVERAVMICLAKSPADRFRTAEELGRALGGDFAGVEPLRPVDPSPSAAAQSASSVRLAAGVAGAVVAIGALLTAVGFLTTRIYDLKLRIPPELTPSRTDFTVVGVHALLPALVYGVAALAVFVALRFVWSLVAAGLRRVHGVRATLHTVADLATDGRRMLRWPWSAGTVADAYLLGSIVLSLGVLFPFRELLAGVTWTSGTEILGCSARTLHRAFTIGTPLLIATLGLAWHGFFRYQRARRATGTRVAIAKWGGLIWIFLVTVVMTLPWRLLYDTPHPRALLDGERGYIVMETDTELLVYRPSSRSTARIPAGAPAELERLGTSGYLFEGPESFRSPDPGC